MIKRILLILVALVPLCMAADSAKIAVVNIQAIYNAMPEKVNAEAQLQQMSAQYQAEYKSLQDEFNKKYAAYQTLAADATVLASIKERRMQEIQANDQMIQDFLKKADADLASRKTALNDAIMEKIKVAVKAVGDEEECTYILDVSSTPVVYTGADAVDLTAKVKAKLGL